MTIGTQGEGFPFFILHGSAPTRRIEQSFAAVRHRRGLAPAPVDIARTAAAHPSNNWSHVFVTVTGKNAGDLVAHGARTAGEVGDRVRVDVGAVNEGPAVIDSSRLGGYIVRIAVTIPTGTTAVEVSQDCHPMEGDWSPDPDAEAGAPGARRYLCLYPDFFVAVGEWMTRPFTLRIDRVIPRRPERGEDHHGLSV